MLRATMRRLFWQVSTTLDGFMEDAQRGLERTAGVLDEDFERYASAMVDAISGFVVGRRTYELFVGYWPQATGHDADRLNALPKLVASRTLERAQWNNAELARDGVAAVRRWKQEDGSDLALFGSSELAESLLAAGLIDELRLRVTPFVLGGGTRTFAAAGRACDLRLVRAETWRSGTLFATYRPA